VGVKSNDRYFLQETQKLVESAKDLHKNPSPLNTLTYTGIGNNFTNPNSPDKDNKEKGKERYEF